MKNKDILNRSNLQLRGYVGFEFINIRGFGMNFLFYRVKA